MKLSIIIPAYNEERTIREVLQRVTSVNLPDGMSKEVIVVNDGSTDGTGQTLSGMQDHPEIRVIDQKTNAGKTSAIRVGIKNASGEYLLVQDADLEYRPEDYPALLKPILRQDADVVYGSRFKGTIQGMTLVNRLANILSNITFNLLFGTRLTDINTCFKLFDRKVFRDITIISEDFVFETEVTAKLIRQGYRILEVPIHYAARTNTAGKKMNWGKALPMYWGIVRFRFK